MQKKYKVVFKCDRHFLCSTIVASNFCDLVEKVKKTLIYYREHISYGIDVTSIQLEDEI